MPIISVMNYHGKNIGYRACVRTVRIKFLVDKKYFYGTLAGVMKLLRITFENAKLKGIWHFSLPSGWSCPGAQNCYTKADRVTGKITDLQTPDADGVTYRCYAAMDEARRPNVRKVRWDNFDLLKERKSTKEKVTLIVSSIRNSGLARGGTLRVHIGGDYYSQSYFNAWMQAAKFFPKIVFYSYTKSIKFLLEYIAAHGGLPSNFVFTCSKGGKYDNLIPQTLVKSAKVFFNMDEANALGLEIDHTDDLAISGSDDFALVIHGSQPAGSAASKALSANKKKGFTGYTAKVTV
tara:strand:- start:2480 stop:3355 length:876 start_codon:yes stop_codon:yes gene_type:complete